MSKVNLLAKDQRRARTRAKVSGTPERPRLNVHISNQHITAQLIDDLKGITLASSTTVTSQVKGNLTTKAAWVGEQIGVAAKKHKITKVVFDRGHKVYHGRLHTLAEAARAKGLEF